jgi:hypothetical protein
MSRIFTCKDCGLEINSIGFDTKEDICAVCRWIRNNMDLTPEERKELRLRLRGEVDVPSST